MLNVASSLSRGRAQFPHRAALVFEEKIYSYLELEEMSRRLAHGLYGLGIRDGERVALLLPNSPEFIVSYFGTLRTGAIAVSISTALATPEIEIILRDSQPLVLITTRELCLKHNLTDLHPPAKIITVGETPHCESFEQMMSFSSAHQPVSDMQADSPAAILYTSGTTGRPKGATLSHGNILFIGKSKLRYFQTTGMDRLWVCLPLSHCFAQNAIMNHGLFAGATILLRREFRQDELWQAISREHGPTMLFGVPPYFSILMNSPGGRSSLGSLRFCFSSAARLPPALAAEWQERFGTIIYEGYGLTETSPATFNHETLYKPGSIGTPMQDVEMSIQTFDGHPATQGEPGEVIIRGPNLMLGYWNSQSRKPDAVEGGWLKTGDVGFIDPDGYFFLTDRLKDMINVGGLKVYSSEVEDVIRQHPAVLDVAVYGKQDRLMGEIVFATVVPRPGHNIAKAELISYCQSRLAKFKVPYGIDFRDSIPSSPTGKVLKRVLRNETTPQI